MSQQMGGACPACSAADAAVEAKLAPYTAWRCGACGSDWIDRADLTANPPPAYDGYDHNANVLAEFTAIRDAYQESFERRLARGGVPADRSGLKFLDFGCAGGEFLACARAAGFAEAAGVEIDAVARKNAQTYGRVETDLSGFETGGFDVVQCKNVISNLEHLDLVMGELVRVTKPGGLLWIDVLNRGALNAWVRRHVPGVNKGLRYGYLRPPYVVTTFTGKGARALFARYGLTPTHVAATHFGGPDVPRRLTPRQLAIGRLGSALGMGSVWVCDLRKPHG